MNRLATFLFLTFASLYCFGAALTENSIRGTGGVLVTSNTITHIVTVDGSGISSPTGGVSATTATNIAIGNAIAIQSGAGNNNLFTNPSVVTDLIVRDTTWSRMIYSTQFITAQLDLYALRDGHISRNLTASNTAFTGTGVFGGALVVQGPFTNNNNATVSNCIAYDHFSGSGSGLTNVPLEGLNTNGTMLLMGVGTGLQMRFGTDLNLLGDPLDPTLPASITTQNSNSYFLMAHGSPIYSANYEQEWLFNHPATGSNNVVRLGELTNLVQNPPGTITGNAAGLTNITVSAVDAFQAFGHSYIAEQDIGGFYDPAEGAGNGWFEKLSQNSNFTHYAYWQNYGSNNSRWLDVSNSYWFRGHSNSIPTGARLYDFFEAGINAPVPSDTNHILTTVLLSLSDGHHPVLLTDPTNYPGQTVLQSLIQDTNNQFIRAICAANPSITLIDAALLLFTNSTDFDPLSGHPSIACNQRIADYVASQVVPPNSKLGAKWAQTYQRFQTADVLTVKTQINCGGIIRVTGGAFARGRTPAAEFAFNGVDGVFGAVDANGAYTGLYFQGTKNHFDQGPIEHGYYLSNTVTAITRYFGTTNAPTFPAVAGSTYQSTVGGTDGMLWVHTNSSINTSWYRVVLGAP